MLKGQKKMIRDIYNEVKWAYQRVKRGYDDTIMWGLEGYFEQAIPAIENFCVENLEDKEYMKLNPERQRIFSETIRLIQEFRQMKPEDNYEHPNQVSQLWSYIGENVGCFWD